MAVCRAWSVRLPAGNANVTISGIGLDFADENHYHLYMGNQQSIRTQKTGFIPAPAADRPPRVSSGQLLGTRGELVIEHEGREYRLRMTQNHKLILTA